MTLATILISSLIIDIYIIPVTNSHLCFNVIVFRKLNKIKYPRIGNLLHNNVNNHCTLYYTDWLK